MRSKTLLKEIKNDFGGLISRLDMTEERIYEFEDMSIETSKTEEQREKRWEKRKKTTIKDILNCRTSTKGLIYT